MLLHRHTHTHNYIYIHTNMYIYMNQLILEQGKTRNSFKDFKFMHRHRNTSSNSWDNYFQCSISKVNSTVWRKVSLQKRKVFLHTAHTDLSVIHKWGRRRNAGLAIFFFFLTSTLSTLPHPSPLSLYPLIPGSHRKYPTRALSGPGSQTQPGPPMGGTGRTSHSDYGQSEHWMPKRRKMHWQMFDSRFFFFKLQCLLC